ncbi:MAG: hypothetical protein U9P79_00615 [Candidatus Cloacimonadota bacterium]|nr:hypothetical protein [Candidatus Cloacimonadota bacterium]
MKKKILLISFFLAVIFLQGCYTPATFQSTKLLPPKALEITPIYTVNKPYFPQYPNFGFIVNYGLNAKKNLLFRYEKIGGTHLHYLAIGGKKSLIKDKLAYSDFWGIYIGTFSLEKLSICMFEYSPSLNYTFFSNKYLETSLSVNFPIDIFVHNDISGLWIGDIYLNFCPAFSTDFAKYSIRPLFGMTTSILLRGVWFFGGLGISYNF